MEPGSDFKPTQQLTRSERRIAAQANLERERAERSARGSGVPCPDVRTREGKEAFYVAFMGEAWKQLQSGRIEGSTLKGILDLVCRVLGLDEERAEVHTLPMMSHLSEAVLDPEEPPALPESGKESSAPPPVADTQSESSQGDTTPTTPDS